MSVFSGPQGKHAMRRHRENLRLEAADRRAARDHKAVERTPEQLLRQVFGEPDDDEQEEQS